VVEAEGPSLTLVTNAHYTSTTDFSSQRYMRAFVHVPLLLADGVERVMVMCYGVGNTVDATLLHRGVRSVDVVDLSRDVLEHARYFASANGEPLADPRVHVYVNDARHHLRMQAGETYDLITGEPPPIAHAGVVNLYSREFFELAASRLRPRGMLTYWLPLNQVGEEVARSIVRAFLDVFPGAVLLSGHGHQLILVGRKGGTLALDPERVRRALAGDPTPTMHALGPCSLRWTVRPGAPSGSGREWGQGPGARTRKCPPVHGPDLGCCAARRRR
jgi:predicted membrane-bound spermidine synthase